MYKKMYLRLFNAITDALGLMEKGDPAGAAEVLKRAQQGAEEIYMEGGGGEHTLRAPGGVLSDRAESTQRHA